VKASYTRLDLFTNALKDKHGVEIVDSIDELVKKVDVVLLESVDGRPHLKQVIPVLKAGKRVFIDKPIAGSLADVLMIFEMSKKYNVPLFSSSSFRFGKNIRSIRKDQPEGKIIGANVYSSCALEPTHPDLFWYGIHGVEALYTIMGTGCTTVTRAHTPETDLVTGVWNDGRIGTYRGVRSGKQTDGAIIFCQKKTLSLQNVSGGYGELLGEVTKYFRTGQVPVAAEETIEMFAFMEAADESKRQGGAPVTIASVLEKARKQNEGRKLE
jgi:predicted dehydrogenase